MTSIKTTSFAGGAGLVPGHSAGGDTIELTTTLRDVADDLGTLKTFCNSLRTAYNATLAKLDADGGVTDTNYAATNPAPAAVGTLLTLKV